MYNRFNIAKISAKIERQKLNGIEFQMAYLEFNAIVNVIDSSCQVNISSQ